MGGKKTLRWAVSVLVAASVISCSYLPGSDTVEKSTQGIETQGGAYRITVSRPLSDESQLPQTAAALEKYARQQLWQRYLDTEVKAEAAQQQARLSAYEKRLLARMKWQPARLPAFELPTFTPQVAYDGKTVRVTVEVDKAALQKRLAARIAELDHALLAYRFVPDGQSRLIQIQYLLPAYPLLLERARDRQLLERLPFDAGRRVQDAYASALLGKLQTLLRKFSIELRANLEKDGVVESGLRALLIEQGLSMEDMPDLFVLYDAQRTTQPVNDGVEVTLQGQISLTDADEVPFERFDFRLSKRSETERMAQQKAIREVAERTLQGIDRLLLKRYYVLQGTYQK